jgi:hypothetical protein
LNGPLVETDWRVIIVRPRFETVNAFAAECLPALTLPNATDAGLTFSVEAANARGASPIKMIRIATATSGSLAMSKFFFTTTDHNSFQPQTNGGFHRAAPGSWGPAAACADCKRASCKPSITDCKKCLHFVGSFPDGVTACAVKASHGLCCEFQVCNLVLHFLYRKKVQPWGRLNWKLPPLAKIHRSGQLPLALAHDDEFADPAAGPDGYQELR